MYIFRPFPAGRTNCAVLRSLCGWVDDAIAVSRLLLNILVRSHLVSKSGSACVDTIPRYSFAVRSSLAEATTYGLESHLTSAESSREAFAVHPRAGGRPENPASIFCREGLEVSHQTFSSYSCEHIKSLHERGKVSASPGPSWNLRESSTGRSSGQNFVRHVAPNPLPLLANANVVIYAAS